MTINKNEINIKETTENKKLTLPIQRVKFALEYFKKLLASSFWLTFFQHAHKRIEKVLVSFASIFSKDKESLCYLFFEKCRN